MLREFAFATSVAITTGVVYLGFVILYRLSPRTFAVLFNSQFLGADLTSLWPKRSSPSGVLSTLVILFVSAWLFSFAWAWLYNRLV
jgi:hypothetical protein